MKEMVIPFHLSPPLFGIYLKLLIPFGQVIFENIIKEAYYL